MSCCLGTCKRGKNLVKICTSRVNFPMLFVIYHSYDDTKDYKNYAMIYFGNPNKYKQSACPGRTTGTNSHTKTHKNRTHLLAQKVTETGGSKKWYQRRKTNSKRADMEYVSAKQKTPGAHAIRAPECKQQGANDVEPPAHSFLPSFSCLPNDCTQSREHYLPPIF